MIPFDVQIPTRIVFGPDRLDELGLLAQELAAHRALVVSDPGIVAAGHAPRGIASLVAAGLEVALFDDVVENPTSDVVDRGVEVARRFRPDLLVGLGGGSSLDCAKGINFVYTGGGQMVDYWGVGKARGPMLPLVGVPTTAGTGSEMQSFALISDPATHVKMACGDRRASCRIALLDPKLTVTQPPRVTALTGIDAVAHALETYVTRRRNAFSVVMSREAWLLLEANFARVLEAPDDLQARGAMQLGAALAGLAIEHSMLGAAHALANPLTAHFDLPHGQAVALMLPHVIRFNGVEHDAWYRELLEFASGTRSAPPAAAGAEGLADFVTGLVARAGLATRLSECGVDLDNLATLAEEAAQQWTGTFNPRPAGPAELLSLYEAAR